MVMSGYGKTIINIILSNKKVLGSRNGMELNSLMMRKVKKHEAEY
jgi:hypothetical protein